MSARIKSRVARNLETQSRKQIIVFTAGILIVLYLVLQYGVLLLGEFGSIISNIKEKAGGDSKKQTVRTVFTEPPVLSIPFSATNSAEIIISGKTNVTTGTVEIYVNSDLQQEIALAGKESFRTQALALQEGENKIKARLKRSTEQLSDYTDEYTVSYIKKEPKLDISYPSDNSTFFKADSEITVQGNTDINNKVRVNSFYAIVDHQGNFSYLIRLSEGENHISIEAQDAAGNITKKEIKVSYQP